MSKCKNVSLPENMGSEKMIEVKIDMEEEEPLGATSNDKLVITKIQSETISEGKLRVDNQVKKVNAVDCKDANDYFRAIQYAAPLARILVNRDEKKAEELEVRVHIPKDSAKIIQPREGYVYEMTTLVWVQNGPKLGLGIKHFRNQVLASRIDPGSLEK
ncbi:hypothetical protein GCK72_012504 [Caenorhabditis remanei]|uniref:PDZ domain-containing protein n=1 Tax=Caenorhabditis remanei TaxID=31234 RepID=A0A6A5GN67_CAERE|nr:hypothetical protein GCK72_012504 [Caenorhabditis remanei]KAF1756051.1 hypothetical protein GCK72_012504 [Caenorhabditis remanei]